MHGKPSAKFKYVMGEPTYKNKFYDALVLPIQGIEGNQVCGNAKYTIVSYPFVCFKLTISLIKDPMERWWWFIHY